MEYTVSITEQGQLTIPVAVRKQLNISGQTKATIVLKNDMFIVKPQEGDFWSLAGSLYNGKIASDEEIRAAKDEFARTWGHKDINEAV